MLRCAKNFSPMALLQVNKKKTMKYIFSFKATHTPLSRAQDITRRNTAGWQFRNKYHTNKNASHYTSQILLECTHLKDDTMWGLLSQRISYAPVPLPPFTLHLYRTRLLNIHALSLGGLEWRWHKQPWKKASIRMGHKNVQHETAVHAGDSTVYFVGTFSKENTRDY